MALNIVALFISVLIFSVFPGGYVPSSNYYYKTCPGVDSIVTNVVTNAVSNDKTVTVALLRMHFHDCFEKGCDASVLLNSKGNKKEEKDERPNVSLHAFYVIDKAKE
ncbi:hypothetical protein FNV43_RR18627 [Rhamnella rubrinervis]|uniref:peroxidase n=1 Tax=Rhamnella rubrinervis TaxID=2594499 RepID=A0A8K0E5F7_9ROSA|nr:hypothetical protein FNV43_RR18627 [Rhamnella rubrinervis]